MVKLYGPMFSLAASGTLADTVTYSTWKGRAYARERVIPSNPKSGAQVGRRAMFTFLTQNWAALGTSPKASWQDLADEIVASTFNAYLKSNMENWHNFLAPNQTSPTTRSLNGSDNVITGADWEENRIKLTLEGTALAEAWGIILFATDGTGFTPGVGNAIIAYLDTTIAEHFIYWTPPSVTTWYFNSIAFSADGAKETAGGEDSAAPP